MKSRRKQQGQTPINVLSSPKAGLLRPFFILVYAGLREGKKDDGRQMEMK
jgi:hypothetical protein